MGGIIALVGGVGKLGILGTRAMVGGQHVGWCDQRHLVPIASASTGSSWDWKRCRRRLLTIQSALVTKGLISKSLMSLVLAGEWKCSGRSPPALAIHYISYQ